MLYYQSWFYFSWCPETLWFPKNPFLSSPFFHENVFDMSFGKALTATTICQAYHMPEMFWYAVNCAYKGFSNRCGRLFKETLQWKQCDPWVRGFILNHSSVIYPLTITQKENARLKSTIYVVCAGCVYVCVCRLFVCVCACSYIRGRRVLGSVTWASFPFLSTALSWRFLEDSDIA